MSTDFAKTYQDQLSICIDQAIIEDIGHGDQTSLAIFDAAHQSSAQLIAKGDGVFAGLGFVQMLFERVAPDVQVIEQHNEGSPFKAGEVLLHLKGATQSILSLERIALNALQRMSGIAKITHSLQQKIMHIRLANCWTPEKPLLIFALLKSGLLRSEGGPITAWGYTTR